MVGYDTSYKKDEEAYNKGYTLSVFIHWGEDENPPKNRKEALIRLKNTINNIEPILYKIKEDADE